MKKRKVQPTLRRDRQAFAAQGLDDTSDEEEEVTNLKSQTPSPHHSNQTQGSFKKAISPTSTPMQQLLDAPISHKLSTPTVPQTSSGHTPESPKSQKTNVATSVAVTPNNFHLQVSSQNSGVVLRSVVNSLLFRKLKFFDVNEHRHYSLELNTVCGILVKACNVSTEDAESWWVEVRATLCRCLTEHRNNVIKAIKKYFSSWLQKCRDLDITCFDVDEKAVFFVEHEDDLGRHTLRLGRRFDSKAYFYFLDHFAPALLGVRTWRAKRAGDAFERILTVSDEAFLLCVVDGNWMRWEYMMAHNTDDDFLDKAPAPKYTYIKKNASARRGNKGCGWREVGKAMLNRLYTAVTEDRQQHGATFDIVAANIIAEERRINEFDANSKKRARTKITLKNDL